jgi:hypothetical protein
MIIISEQNTELLKGRRWLNKPLRGGLCIRDRIKSSGLYFLGLFPRPLTFDNECQKLTL